MKKLFASLIVVMLVFSAGYVKAEPMVSEILNTLYGVGNWQPYIGPDVLWFNLNGHSEAQARYAGYTQNFGYIIDTDSDGVIDPGKILSAFSTLPIRATCSRIRLMRPTCRLDPIFSSGQMIQADFFHFWTSLPNPNDHMKTFLITGGSQQVITLLLGKT